MLDLSYNLVTSTGTIVPDTSETRAEIEAEWKDTFGQDLRTTSDTRQGQWIDGETSARMSVVRNNATLANQINPNLSGGIFLDAILALTGVERDPSMPTIVVAQIAGVAGTIVPDGSLAATSPAGDVFRLLGTVTLATTAPVSVTFQSVENGPIACNPGDLTRIVEGATLGWESITNADPGVLGQLSQSDLEARRLRRDTMGAQGTALPVAITSALYLVEGVRSLSFRENVTAATVVIDGITMVPHSIYVCVDGGTDEDIARALLDKKSLGANWNGSNTVNIVEPASGQSYATKFDRTAAVPVLARFTVRAGTSLVNPIDAVKFATLKYAAGEIEGERGFVTDADVSAFELGGAVNKEYPGMYVSKVEIALASDGIFQTDQIPIAINEKATINSASITVIVA